MSEDVAEIYKGSYKYFNNGRGYSDENFSVLKDFANNNLIYNIEILTRVATGELLKVEIKYVITHQFAPVEVTIEKSLGDKFSKETFRPGSQSNILEYTFEGAEGRKAIKVNCPGKYHISTPAVSTSMFFTRSKKYDPTIINSVNIITSDNNWEFEKPPKSKSVYFRSNNHQQEDIRVNGKNLTGVKYTLFVDEKDEQDANVVTYYLSKHIALPYMVTAGEELKIEVRNLQDLNPQRMEDFF